MALLLVVRKIHLLAERVKLWYYKTTDILDCKSDGLILGLLTEVLYTSMIVENSEMNSVWLTDKKDFVNHVMGGTLYPLVLHVNDSLDIALSWKHLPKN